MRQFCENDEIKIQGAKGVAGPKSQVPSHELELEVSLGPE
jgi:hypothetical protein